MTMIAKGCRSSMAGNHHAFDRSLGRLRGCKHVKADAGAVQAKGAYQARPCSDGPIMAKEGLIAAKQITEAALSRAASTIRRAGHAAALAWFDVDV
jgi:hypothetical protein